MRRNHMVVTVFASLLIATLRGPTQASEAPASAPSPTRGGATGFKDYDRIRQALASDSLENVHEYAKAMESDLRGVAGSGRPEAAEAAKAAEQLAGVSALEAARNSFKSLSDSYIRFLEQANATGELTRFHCPMAKADWVQADRPAANPYFGASMLRCGAVVPWKEKASK